MADKNAIFLRGGGEIFPNACLGGSDKMQEIGYAAVSSAAWKPTDPCPYLPREFAAVLNLCFSNHWNIRS